ncbi:MAG: hypothetical protein JKY65_10070 [Planctomycetes bacterium]|nr:hypothetical protein [Planctomycetota bacterium]
MRIEAPATPPLPPEPFGLTTDVVVGAVVVWVVVGAVDPTGAAVAAEEPLDPEPPQPISVASVNTRKAVRVMGTSEE